MANYDSRYFNIEKTCEECGELNRVYKTYSKQYRYYCNCEFLTDRIVYPTNRANEEIKEVKDENEI